AHLHLLALALALELGAGGAGALVAEGEVNLGQLVVDGLQRDFGLRRRLNDGRRARVGAGRRHWSGAAIEGARHRGAAVEEGGGRAGGVKAADPGQSRADRETVEANRQAEQPGQRAKGSRPENSRWRGAGGGRTRVCRCRELAHARRSGAAPNRARSPAVTA